MTHQFETLKSKRENNLTENEVYLWVDFAENWCTKMARETQSVHFGGSRQQYTLHTGVGYLKGGLQCFCTLSENRCHGPTEIVAHLKPVAHLLLKKIDGTTGVHMHYQSDGPVTQYRGKQMYAFMAQVLPHLFPQVQTMTWNYTEASHGRGSVDGVGSDVKRKADDAVAHGSDIDTFPKFVECAKSLKGITIEVVTQEDIDEIHRTPVHPKPFKGNNQVHQITWRHSSPHRLYFNYLSCFDCAPGTLCAHYFLGTLDFTSEILREVEQSQDLEQAVDEPDQAVDEPEQAVDETQEPETISKGDWVAVKLSGNEYPG